MFTVFSTSKDHRQGERAMAGCILVDNDKIQVPLPSDASIHRIIAVQFVQRLLLFPSQSVRFF